MPRPAEPGWLTPEQIGRIIAALYGPDASASALARELNVNPRRVREWLQGRYTPNANICREMIELLRQRLTDLQRVLVELEGYPETE